MQKRRQAVTVGFRMPFIVCVCVFGCVNAICVSAEEDDIRLSRNAYRVSDRQDIYFASALNLDIIVKIKRFKYNDL